MFNAISGHYHIWEAGPERVLVSDERVKFLQTYRTVDDAISGLFLDGFKDHARAINKAWQEHKGARV